MTTTGGPRIGGALTGLHAARRTAVSELRSTLAVLNVPSGPADSGSRPDAAPFAVRGTRTRVVRRPECRATRAALHDYLHKRLVPSRRHRVEVHLDRCGECTRAFIDVREVSWALRGLGRQLDRLATHDQASVPFDIRSGHGVSDLEP
ncbi:zf-HC2 domain-containing protein [Promicromonospora iranensis]|uniref:Putative zinc-finger domain-containing protein n=1 Tax=Promicromonospora iranensis TaxID=1105144 RepID=A0ABU2CI55_9MICO|nr:zf-HC2 domain-containing protein [Promicromonospora iranensis]MDR7381015.1 hypothetical protein [Promicromonospora iranensis]